jgi:hypothetical protein
LLKCIFKIEENADSVNQKYADANCDIFARYAQIFAAGNGNV